MANAKQIKALIQCHAEGDEERFYSIAMQVAAHAARQGHGKLAQELKDLVAQAKSKSNERSLVSKVKPIPVAQPRGELAGLLSVGYPKSKLTDMSLSPPVRKRLERVVLEQRQRGKIKEHGLSPLRKLLLTGPPGTGKTMTASALAGELGLPLFTIQLDGLITKFMGETAAKLRLVFDAMKETRGVYLFDEFDSLGGERGSRNDVGEIRRVLNSFLQFLELECSDSLVVASTNHLQLLDRALFRRFDAIIEYGLPSAEIATKVMQSRLAFLDVKHVDWEKVSIASKGLSHASITQACEHVAKNAILQDTRKITTEEIVEALKERQREDG